jgi:hypothetical protein
MQHHCVASPCHDIDPVRRSFTDMFALRVPYSDTRGLSHRSSLMRTSGRIVACDMDLVFEASVRLASRFRDSSMRNLTLESAVRAGHATLNRLSSVPIPSA